MEIKLKPIGIIHSPYKVPKNISIQGKFDANTEAFIELYEKYVPGLKDLKDFSHAIILYYFHKSNVEKILGTPFLEDEAHGIFAIRSPNRPNHIGFSIVKIKKIEGSKLHFTEVDMLDGTPVLDIKPYSKYFDCRENSRSGWIEKHFENGSLPDNVFLK